MVRTASTPHSSSSRGTEGAGVAQSSAFLPGIPGSGRSARGRSPGSPRKKGTQLNVSGGSTGQLSGLKGTTSSSSISSFAPPIVEAERTPEQKKADAHLAYLLRREDTTMLPPAQKPFRRLRRLHRLLGPTRWPKL